jgi:hypothetical protein
MKVSRNRRKAGNGENYNGEKHIREAYDKNKIYKLQKVNACN